MTQIELSEHRGYLADERRVAAYRAALAEVVRPDDVVLDLGCGTGLLGYLACEAGATSVVSVDRGDILGLARRIAADNGYADRIRHVQALSTELELASPADMAVCDQIGGLVHDAGVLSFFADARRRLLAPGARLVPASFRIFLAPVTFEIGRRAIEFWSTKPARIDVGAARTLVANTEGKYNVTADDVVALAPGAEVTSFAADHDQPITGTAHFELACGGRFDGFVGWFTAELSPSSSLTNDPWSPERFDRWCNFYPVDHALDLRRRDQVEVALDIRPRLDLVSWTTTVTGADGRTRRSRQSSLQGALLTGSTLDRLAPDQPIPVSDRVALARTILDLIDGSRTQADVVAALHDRVGPGRGFTTTAQLERFVRNVAALAR
jgi:SAM-dependent methyltransferase